MKKLILAVLFVFALSSVAMASPLTDFSKGKAALDLNYRSSGDYDANIGVNGTGWKSPDFAFDGNNNLEWGFTYGIGNNWALQYRQATPKGNFTLWNQDYTEGSVAYKAIQSGDVQDALAPIMYPIMDYAGLDKLNVGIESKVKVDEYNVLYKINKNFAAFTGLVKAYPSAKLAIAGHRYGHDKSFDFDAALAGHDKNIWQFGLQAVAPFADKFTGYGIASFGSDYRNWELGLGYQLSKDLELNVNYRSLKIENMSMVGLNAPISSELHIGDVTSDVQKKGWGFGVTYKF